MLEVVVAVIILSFAIVVVGTELSLQRRRGAMQSGSDGTPVSPDVTPFPLWPGWDAGGLGVGSFGGDAGCGGGSEGC